MIALNFSLLIIALNHSIFHWPAPAPARPASPAFIFLSRLQMGPRPETVGARAAQPSSLAQVPPARLAPADSALSLAGRLQYPPSASRQTARPRQSRPRSARPGRRRRAGAGHGSGAARWTVGRRRAARRVMGTDTVPRRQAALVTAPPPPPPLSALSGWARQFECPGHGRRPAPWRKSAAP